MNFSVRQNNIVGVSTRWFFMQYWQCYFQKKWIFAAVRNTVNVKNKKFSPTLCSVILFLGWHTTPVEDRCKFLTKRNPWHLILLWNFFSHLSSEKSPQHPLMKFCQSAFHPELLFSCCLPTIETFSRLYECTLL